ncbi:MAG: acyltransferase [Muribaculaceae bacterium]|nr:acyltransferase [Muribaculaceae bacterium]
MKPVQYAYRLKRSNNNMDAMRYVLSLSVIISHFNFLCGYSIPWFISPHAAVGCFFALSGFLIYGSYSSRANPSLASFFAGRARRILPPYIFIVVLCALALSAVSSLGVRAYFADAGFWKYLAANISFCNFLHPGLPGVFDGPEYSNSAVNGSLWTMKVEWFLYASVPVVAAICEKLRRWLRLSAAAVIVALIVTAIVYKSAFAYIYAATGHAMYEILGRQFVGQLDYFYTGALIYICFDHFMRRKWIFLACGIALALLQDHIPGYHLWLEALVNTTVMMAVCMSGKRSVLSHHDNVSYDMYLFHYPVMQTAVYIGLPAIGCYSSFAIVLAAVVLLSFASWNIIGRRFVKPAAR